MRQALSSVHRRPSVERIDSVMVQTIHPGSAMKQACTHRFRLALIGLLVPLGAHAESPSPCAFTVGHSAVQGQHGPADPRLPSPYWFVVSGRAEVELIGRSLTARLYDSRTPNEHSHTLNAALARPLSVSHPKTTATGSLRNLASDAGNDAVSGSLQVTNDMQAPGKPRLHSMVLHNPHTFVAVSCYGKSAA